MSSENDTPATRRWSAWQAIALYAVALLCLLLAMGWVIKDRYARDMEAARGATLAHAELMAEWGKSAFTRVDDTLGGLANLFAVARDDATAPAARLTENFEVLLDRRRERLPFLEAVGLFDAEGRLRYASGPPDSARAMSAPAEAVEAFLADPEEPDSAVRWERQEQERGPQLFYLRRLVDADSRVIGVAVARMDLRFFSQALSRLQLGAGQSIAFLDDHMRLVARRPPVPGMSVSEAMGLPVEAPSVAEAIAEPGASSHTLTSPLDERRRMFSVVGLEGLPFSAVVGLASDTVLADWRQKVLVLALGWMLVALIGLLALVHYLRLTRTEAQLVRSEQRLWDINRSLQAELRIAAMAFDTHLGMFITDAQGRIQKVNRTFEAITGYTEAEVLGRNPRMLNSGRHPPELYQEMWQRLDAEGRWQGELWNRRKNGDTYPQRLTISAVSDEAGTVTHYVATLSDITTRKAAEQEAHRLAFYDPLTGLPNRRMMLDRIGRALEAQARTQQQGALLFVDLDGFKHINDSLGHQQGDDMLQLVARRFEAVSGDSDLVARIGGDEFVILAEGLGEDLEAASQLAERIANRLLGALAEPCGVGEQRHPVSGSVGITLLGDGTGSVDECLQQAEMAMYQAKQAGRNTLRFFDPLMQAEAVRRATLETDLRQAVARDQLRLFYQVQVDASWQVTGVEALLRWQHPEHGMVPPGDFIPVAEESYLIVSIGRWVLETACRQLARWAETTETAGLTMAVNISPHQFQQPDFVTEVETVLAATEAPPERLKLELTETLFMEEPEIACATMQRLKTLGVRFSLDDFGTGFSSLTYLNQLPLDQLKIDQSFVRPLFQDSANEVISASIIQLGRNLGLEVIAEGVETEAHCEWLAEQGCHAYQGYLFSRPLPLDELMERLASWSCVAGR
ncbi:EAL domain-containing protein [Halomonas sp. NO4]|uniref:bifunctional diguanylate cyclase/phosphodiesterase n=1 Tax=Halomonas sp. NO4 TaxID=2484813 RepID=UPI0013D1C277|nr:EAL domain-containing protein [Halomonas sp. NO4]